MPRLPPTIALLTDGGDSARLAEEAAALGIRLSILGYDELGLGDKPPPIDCVLARFIKGGSLEEITFRLSLLHSLRQSGVTVINSAATIERTVDKGLAAFILAEGGVATPPTWTYSSAVLAAKRLKTELELGHKLVAKPLFGAGGKGLELVERQKRLPRAKGGVWHLQRFVDGGGKDWRVFVIGGEAVASMSRRGCGWISNVAQGAVTAATAPKEVEALAVAAAAAIGADYAGVDVIKATDGGYSVLELNGIPGFTALEETTGVNVAARLLEYALEHSLKR